MKISFYEGHCTLCTSAIVYLDNKIVYHDPRIATIKKTPLLKVECDRIYREALPDRPFAILKGDTLYNGDGRLPIIKIHNNYFIDARDNTELFLFNGTSIRDCTKGATYNEPIATIVGGCASNLEVIALAIAGFPRMKPPRRFISTLYV